MTKGQFALLTAALGLVTMAGTGYIGYAHADSAGSPGAGVSGRAMGGGSSTGSVGAAGGATGAAAPNGGASPAAGAANSAAGAGSGSPAAQTSASAPACDNAEIQVSETDGEGAAGHLSLLIDFTNVSRHVSSLHGYPGASIFGPEGALLANARRTLVGQAGGAVGLNSPPQVVLQPDGTASAVVEWSDVPTGSGGCLNPVSLGVTPPNTKQTTTFELTGQPEVCSGFEVHPVLAGNAYTG